MIVRCTSCNSAFAVDDSKVAKKKFAFTCPKCASENVIDNRVKTEAAVIMDEATPGIRAATDQRSVRENLSPRASDSFEIPEAVRPDSNLAEIGEDGLSEMPDFQDEPIEGKTQQSGKNTADDFDDSLETELKQFDEELQSDRSAKGSKDVPLDDLDFGSLDLEEDPENLETSKDKRSISDELDDLDLDDFNKAGTKESGETVIQDELDEFSDIEEAINLDDFEGDLNLDDASAEIIDDFLPIESVDVTHEKNGERSTANVKTEKLYPADETEDESITIDLDSLDIDLEEIAAENTKPLQSIDRNGIGSEKSRTSVRSLNDDEDVTLDLESLDIDLSDEPMVKKGEEIDYLGIELPELDEKLEGKDIRDEESVTLDLDSLDIALDDNIELKKGEAVDEDEKITLEDAGLTMDELTADEVSSISTNTAMDYADEEDIKLTIDEIDPNLTIDQIENELKGGFDMPVSASTHAKKSDAGLILDEFEDLPDIDFDLDEPGSIAGIAAGSAARSGLTLTGRGDAMIGGGIKKEIPDLVVKGDIHFSIDYSIKYSRLRAALRLLGIFGLGLFPHYFVFCIYSILSLILGSLNHIIIIFTGKDVEDFSEIQVNTLRYMLSISASFVGVVEEMPIFVGRDNIDYALQMKVIYPFRHSRVLAGLRLSLIGILLATLPHFFILGAMSLVMVLLFYVGIIGVLVTGRWPGLLFDIFTRYYRYTASVTAFTIGIVDVYPSFKFK